MSNKEEREYKEYLRLKEKYDNIPYFDNETRIEIIENIKKYIQNQNKILTK